MGAPTAVEQYLLELINQARLDPGGEFDRLIKDAATQTGHSVSITSAIRYFDVDMDVLRAQLDAIDQVAPLAWDSRLNEAAAAHTDLMAANDSQSHQEPGELDLGDRITAAGYEWSRVGENVYSYASDADYAHAGFYIDWGPGATGIQSGAGHRVAITNGNYTEVGVAVLEENDPETTVGDLLVTQDFGTPRTGQARILGVVYDDADDDAFYSIGEGRGGVTLTVAGEGAVASGAAGGYQIETGAGAHDVSFSGGGLGGAVSATVDMSADNIKLDLVDGGTLLSSASLTLTGGAKGARLLGGEDLDLTGGSQRDVLIGNTGDNTLTGRDGLDRIEGGDGSDMLLGGGFDDGLFGQRHSDEIYGGWGQDRLRGGSGGDHLQGDGGNDRLFGEWGADVLIGGAGDDHLSGGQGRDTYQFGAADGDDLIVDFDPLDQIRAVGVSTDDVTIDIIGGDARLTIGATTVLVLDGAGEVEISDFVFV